MCFPFLSGRAIEETTSNMLITESCFCCSVAIAAGFVAVYLLITYLIAFAFELLWILESATTLPTASILCALYFTLSLFAAMLIHGLATKNTLCLISWMFAATLLTFPEAGMVIYMSTQYWRIESLYGVTELSCWLARILANVIEVVIVQGLYSVWKEEASVNRRLRDLSLQAITIPLDAPPSTNHFVGPLFYQNKGFHASLDNLDMLKRSASQIWNPGLSVIQNNFAYDDYPTTPSEFNASIFSPKLYNKDCYETASKKSQSMLDLRTIDENRILNNDNSNKLPHLYGGVKTQNYSSMSLGRQTRIPKFVSVDNLCDFKQDGHVIKNRNGYFAQPSENFGVPIYYGPLDGPDFLIYRKQADKLSSKNSLSNASVEDVQKYRDVAL